MIKTLGRPRREEREKLGKYFLNLFLSLSRSLQRDRSISTISNMRNLVCFWYSFLVTKERECSLVICSLPFVLKKATSERARMPARNSGALCAAERNTLYCCPSYALSSISRLKRGSPVRARLSKAAPLKLPPSTRAQRILHGQQSS